jgi:hypothetical protein
MTAREREARENARSAFGMSGWSDRRNDGLGGGSDRVASVADRMRAAGYGYGADGALTRDGVTVGRPTSMGGLMTTPDSYMADPDHLGMSVNRPLKKSIFPVFTPKTCSPQQLA